MKTASRFFFGLAFVCAVVFCLTILGVSLFGQTAVTKNSTGVVNNGPITIGANNTISIAAGGTLNVRPGAIVTGLSGTGSTTLTAGSNTIVTGILGSNLTYNGTTHILDSIGGGGGGGGNVTAAGALTSGSVVIGQGGTAISVIPVTWNGTNTTLSLTGNLSITGSFTPGSISGVFGVANGGTGVSSFTAGDILVATGATTLVKQNIGTDGQVLTVDTTQPSKTKWAAAGATYTAGMTMFWPVGLGSVPAGWSLAGANGVPSFTAPDANYESITYLGSTVADPVFSPAAGTYAGGTSITFTVPAGATGVYTTDGSTPTRTHGTTYTTAPTLTSSGTYKARNYKDYSFDSGVVSAAYVVSGSAPTLLSATIATNGLSISLAFDQSMQFGGGGNAGWASTLTGGADALTYSSGTGTSTLVYSLGRQVMQSETGTLAYTQPTAGVQSTGSVDLVTLSGFAITNGSTQVGQPNLIAHVGASSSSGTPNTVTTAAINTTGSNLIVISTAWYPGTVTNVTVADSAGNTWTALTKKTDAGFATSGQLFYCYNPTTSASHTVTVSGSSGIYNTVEVAAFNNAASTPFDQESGSNANSVTSIQPGSVTPAQAHTLVIVASGFEPNSAGSITINGGYTITDTQAAVSGGVRGSSLSYLVLTTASAQNPTYNFTNSVSSATCELAVFKW